MKLAASLGLILPFQGELSPKQCSILKLLVQNETNHDMNKMVALSTSYRRVHKILFHLGKCDGIYS